MVICVSIQSVTGVKIVMVERCVVGGKVWVSERFCKRHGAVAVEWEQG